MFSVWLCNKISSYTADEIKNTDTDLNIIFVRHILKFCLCSVFLHKQSGYKVFMKLVKLNWIFCKFRTETSTSLARPRFSSVPGKLRIWRSCGLSGCVSAVSSYRRLCAATWHGSGTSASTAQRFSCRLTGVGCWPESEQLPLLEYKSPSLNLWIQIWIFCRFYLIFYQIWIFYGFYFSIILKNEFSLHEFSLCTKCIILSLVIFFFTKACPVSAAY